MNKRLLKLRSKHLSHIEPTTNRSSDITQWCRIIRINCLYFDPPLPHTSIYVIDIFREINYKLSNFDSRVANQPHVTNSFDRICIIQSYLTQRRNHTTLMDQRLDFYGRSINDPFTLQNVNNPTENLDQRPIGGIL